MESERLAAKVLHCSVNGRREQGRQPKKWIDNVKEDMDTRKIHFQQAVTRVHDRAKLKRQVAAALGPYHFKNDGREKRRRKEVALDYQ